MDELRTAKIIKELSEELHDTVAKLRETEIALKTARNDSSDWFMKWQETKKELDLLKAAEKLKADLPTMEV